MTASAGPFSKTPSEVPLCSQPLDILVRDRVPEWLESKGNITVCRVLDDAEFEQALRDSVHRYGQRFAQTADIEALCDLLDAMEAWLQVRGVSPEALERARQERRKRCGGFERRMLLRAVAPGDRALVFRGRTC